MVKEMVARCAICGKIIAPGEEGKHVRETGHNHFRPYFGGDVGDDVRGEEESDDS